MMLLRVIATGRQWGNKVEETTSAVTISGIKCLLREFDAWEGGDGTPHAKQQYYRFISVEPAEKIRDDRFRLKASREE
jgi:hypothetical protein